MSVQFSTDFFNILIPTLIGVTVLTGYFALRLSLNEKPQSLMSEKEKDIAVTLVPLCFIPFSAVIMWLLMCWKYRTIL